MNWKPRVLTGRLVGAGIILLIVLIDTRLLWRVVSGPLNGVTFVCAFLTLLSFPVIATIAYRIYDLMHLRYEFDRNRVVLATASTKQTIPMNRIEGVIDGRKSDLRVRMRSITWPGCLIGQGNIDGIGLTLFYAATPVKEQTIIVTPTLAYGISPPDADNFERVFIASLQMGPSVEVEEKSVQSPHVLWPIWGDRVAHGFFLGSILLCAMLFAILCFRYPSLPNLLSMHYDAIGQVDRIVPRNEVIILPIIGLITWAVNAVLGAICYRRERMISYLMWSGALVVQVFFLLALWNIVT